MGGRVYSALILMKIPHFDGTPLHRCTVHQQIYITIFQVDQVSITCHEYWAVVGCEMYLKFVILSSALALWPLFEMMIPDRLLWKTNTCPLQKGYLVTT